MKKSHLAKGACAMGLAIACMWGIAGCSNGGGSGSTGGVAATVDGTEIAEDTVTDYIENTIRQQESLADENAWGSWLSENGYTPESLREQVIDLFVSRQLIEKGAEERGITVESSEVDSSLESMKSYYDSDEKWQSALQQAGWTEDAYRSEVELRLKVNALQESFSTDEEPSEEDMLSYAQMYATSYDGAKKSSHILFAAGDEAKAQEVLDKVNSGELDFAEAAKQYSTDTGSAEKGGDIGWDVTYSSSGGSLDTDYKTSLEGLEKDQVSGLVTSQFGIHIIKCTDVYTAPEEVTSVDQIPSEWLDSVKETLKSQQAYTDYQTWLTEAKEKADIKINDMPEGLPYYVDMSKYPAPEESTDGTTGGADGSATGEGGTADGSGTGTGTEAGADGSADAGAVTDGSGAAEGSEGSAGSASDQPAEQPADAA